MFVFVVACDEFCAPAINRSKFTGAFRLFAAAVVIVRV